MLSLLEGALIEPDQAKRQDAYYRVQEIMEQEIPAVFLKYVFTGICNFSNRSV